MVIKISKISGDKKPRIPDLITRPLGKSLFNKVSGMISDIHDGEVLLLDFSGFRVLDPSFIDEFIIRLISESRKDSPPFHVKLAAISDIAIMNISSVFKSYNNANTPPMAVVTDSVIHDSYVIGELNPQERDIGNYLQVNKSAASAEIASFLEMDHGDALAMLDSMYRMRIIRKIDHDSVLLYHSL